MIYLVTGTSASGKSEYAESVAVRLYNSFGGIGRLYYVAAMKPFGAEADKRILRHQMLRAGKGFDTIECYTHLERLSAHDRDVFLIECMSNLLANEIYDECGSLRSIDRGEAHVEEQYRREWCTDRLRTSIAEPVLSLAGSAAAVVIVTNDVFTDGRHFGGDEAETELYCRMLGELNIMLAKEADAVVEVVCGMPNVIKNDLSCMQIVKCGNGE